MAKMERWFEVDREGLSEIVERHGGKTRAVCELISNAWDEDGVTEVNVAISREPRSPFISLTIEDDAPNGFQDLRDAFTLFRRSRKREDPEKRGRFNLGEKLFLSLCREATIHSTRGWIQFSPEGRSRVTRTRLRESGTILVAELRIDSQEEAAIMERIRMLIPPLGIRTRVNGTLLIRPRHLRTIEATLPTEYEKSGRMTPTRRKTEIQLYSPKKGHRGMIFEMGIPVVESELPWHVDVEQRVPLTLERDNVLPSFARRLNQAVLDSNYEEIDQEEANLGWVTSVLPDAKPEAIRHVITKRFGERVVTFDPSDPEANKKAIDRGYSVIHGRQFDQKTWKRIREIEDLAPPSGRVIPSGVQTSKEGVEPVENLSPVQRTIRAYAKDFGKFLLGFEPKVVLYDSSDLGIAGAWRAGSLSLNQGGGTTGWGRFFRGSEIEIVPIEDADEDMTRALDDLLIHEFAHHYATDHLSSGFYEACTRLGAKARFFPAGLRRKEVEEEEESS